MYALKALVIFMGLLIVMGLTLIGWGIYKKADDPDFKFFDLGGGDKPAVVEAQTPTAPQVPDTTTSTANPFPGIALNIPEACVVEDMRPAGHLLYLRLGPSRSDCEQILVVDTAQGRQLGTIDIRP